MKKLLSFAMSVALLFMLAACANDNAPNTDSSPEPETSINNSTPEPESKTDNSMGEGSSAAGNTLIAYFTVPETDGVDAVAGASRVVVDEEVLGNTQYIARLIQETAGGELFAIETEQEYPGSHEPLLEFAYQEKGENARPALSTKIDDFDSYDVVFIGFPNWNADLPMPLYTFFEEYDFSGKTVIPFVTHGGSGFSRTIETIKELEPDATVIENGLSISRNNVADAGDEVSSWVSGLSLADAQSN